MFDFAGQYRHYSSSREKKSMEYKGSEVRTDISVLADISLVRLLYLVTEFLYLKKEIPNGNALERCTCDKK